MTPKKDNISALEHLRRQEAEAQRIESRELEAQERALREYNKLHPTSPLPSRPPA